MAASQAKRGGRRRQKHSTATDKPPKNLPVQICTVALNAYVAGVVAFGGYHWRLVRLPVEVHPNDSRNSPGLTPWRRFIIPSTLPLAVPSAIAPASIRAVTRVRPAPVVPSSLGLSCLVGAGALRGGCCGGAVVLRESSRAAIRLSIASRRASSGSGGNCRYWARAAVTRAVLVVPWAVAVASSAVSKSGARRIVREGIAVKVQRQDNGNPPLGGFQFPIEPESIQLILKTCSYNGIHVLRAWTHD
jgi:hypothetical protein